MKARKLDVDGVTGGRRNGVCLATAPAAAIAYGISRARWVLAATVLGSGLAFIDATAVNVAVPAIGHSFGAGLSGLTWTVNPGPSGTLLAGGGVLAGLFVRRPKKESPSVPAAPEAVRWYCGVDGPPLQAVGGTSPIRSGDNPRQGGDRHAIRPKIT